MLSTEVLPWHVSSQGCQQRGAGGRKSTYPADNIVVVGQMCLAVLTPIDLATVKVRVVGEPHLVGSWQYTDWRSPIGQVKNGFAYRRLDRLVCFVRPAEGEPMRLMMERRGTFHRSCSGGRDTRGLLSGCGGAGAWAQLLAINRGPRKDNSRYRRPNVNDVDKKGRRSEELSSWPGDGRAPSQRSQANEAIGGRREGWEAAGSNTGERRRESETGILLDKT